MNNNSLFNMKPEKDINIIKDYDGFISPDGNFYLVSKINVHNPSHIAWADKFISEKYNYDDVLLSDNALKNKSKLNNMQDVLINFYGYVCYSHDSLTRMPIITYPNKKVNDMVPTLEQFNLLWNILKENDELEYAYDEDEIENDLLHESYVDDFIVRKIKERENEKN